MAGIDSAKPTGVSDSFFDKAAATILNLATPDNELLAFLRDAYSNQGSDANLQAINILMNKRNQTSELISNIEEKRHNGAMSIISNVK